MQNPQQAGNQFAQVNFDAAVRMSTQAAEFWRRAAAIQAAGVNQVVEESVRMTRAILKTQAEIVEAAGQCLSEGNRAVFQAAEEGAWQAGDASRQAAGAMQHGQTQTGQRKAA
jgi:hypothetical protein